MTKRVHPAARAVTAAAAAAALGEGELVVLAQRGDAAAFREIMRRHNRPRLPSQPAARHAPPRATARRRAEHQQPEEEQPWTA